MQISLSLNRVVGRSKRNYLELQVWVDNKLEDGILVCKEDILWLLNQDNPPPSL